MLLIDCGDGRAFGRIFHADALGGGRHPATGVVEVDGDRPVGLAVERFDDDVADRLHRLPDVFSIVVAAVAGFADEHAAGVGGLSRLRQLTVPRSVLTDDGARSLMDLEHLQTLALSWAPIGDGGIECVEWMPHLEALFLTGTSVGDAGVASLNAAPLLRMLGVSDTQLTDAGLARLALPQLDDLDVSGSSVTGASFAQLAAASPQLRTLQIGPELVPRHLRHLASLRRLVVSVAPDDEAELLDALAHLESLVELELYGVTPACVDEARRALPRAAVKG